MELLKSRRAGQWLHWIAAAALVGGLAAGTPGTAQAMAWIFAVAAGLWLVRTVLAGPMARPGAALAGPVRAVHLALHRGLLGLVGATALAGVVPAAGALHGPLVWATLGVAAAHLLFNIWREFRGESRVLSRMLPF